MKNSFRSKFINNGLEFSAIDTYIEYWHTHEKVKVSLREYLGLSKEEYNIFIKEPYKLEKQLIGERYGKQHPNS